MRLLQGASQLVSESDEEEEACLQTRSHTDSSEDMAPHINEVCLHQACAAQSSCIVAELETIRDNYTKGRDQFQIKVQRKAHTRCMQLWPGRQCLDLPSQCSLDPEGLICMAPLSMCLHG